MPLVITTEYINQKRFSQDCDMSFYDMKTKHLHRGKREIISSNNLMAVSEGRGRECPL